MYQKGVAMIGFGSSSGPNKVSEATNKAISSPLLEASFSGAKNAIVNVSGSRNLSLLDVNDVVEIINDAAGNDINIILGASYDDELDDEIRVSVIATDFDESMISEPLFVKNPRKSEQSVIQGTLEFEDVEEEDEHSKENDGIIPDFLKKS